MNMLYENMRAIPRLSHLARVDVLRSAQYDAFEVRANVGMGWAIDLVDGEVLCREGLGDSVMGVVRGVVRMASIENDAWKARMLP